MRALIVIYFKFFQLPDMPGYFYLGRMWRQLNVDQNSRDIGLAISITEVSVAAYFSKVFWQNVLLKSSDKLWSIEFHLFDLIVVWIIFIIKCDQVILCIYFSDSTVDSGAFWPPNSVLIWPQYSVPKKSGWPHLVSLIMGFKWIKFSDIPAHADPTWKDQKLTFQLPMAIGMTP